MTGRKRVYAALSIFVLIPVLSLKAAYLDPSNPAIDEKKIEDITRMVSPSVVKVEVRDGIRKVATGVVIDKDGFIVTTALVSPRDEEISVITAEGKRIKAEFKGLDTQTQIALIQAKDKGLTPIAMGKAGDLDPGAWIGVIGLSPENTPAVTQGIVSSLSSQWLRLNVWVVPGASGSPVVNGAGQMVGLLRGAYTDEQPVVFEFREQRVVGSGTVVSRAEAPSAGMALAVPIDILISVAADIKKSGKVERGWLGIRVLETDEELEIVEVQAKSPAELAKFKEGDILRKIDGKDIHSGEAMFSEIRSRRPSQDITVRIERNGKPMDIKVKLGEYTEEEAKRELSLSFPMLFPPYESRPPDMPRIDIPRILVKPKTGPGSKFAWEKRKFIGVSLQELKKEQADFFGIKDGAGLFVWEFTEDSPAKKAGLKIGDVILKVDGKKVETVDELSEIIQNKKKGDKVKIEFVRDKKTMSLEVEIAEEELGWNSLFRSPGDFSRPLWDEFNNYSETSRSRPETMDEFFGENLKNLFEDMNKTKKEFSEMYRSLSRISAQYEI